MPAVLSDRSCGHPCQNTARPRPGRPSAASPERCATVLTASVVASQVHPQCVAAGRRGSTPVALRTARVSPTGLKASIGMFSERSVPSFRLNVVGMQDSFDQTGAGLKIFEGDSEPFPFLNETGRTWVSAPRSRRRFAVLRIGRGLRLTEDKALDAFVRPPPIARPKFVPVSCVEVVADIGIPVAV